MKVIVNDAETLRQVRVSQVAEYLRHRGWKRMRKQPWMQRGTFWRKDSGGKEPWEVLLPDAEAYGDYALRISELLEDLALQEGRSQVAVLRSLQAAGSQERSVVVNLAMGYPKVHGKRKGPHPDAKKVSEGLVKA
ncbi:MAG: hypothetical protein IT162_18310 [Bryobacterales bacterium]|nr:hypothetical protein [Bryobacterales bacterium]